MSFKPTEEQLRIIEAAKSGNDLVVQALAGTGKTTTLKLLAEALHEQRGTYVAFNKAIVDEAVSKFPSNVRCKTAHSLAFGYVGKNYKKRLDGQSRVKLTQVAEWLGVEKIGYKVGKETHILDESQVANLVIASVDNFCKSVDSGIKLEHIEIPFLASMDKKLSGNFKNELLPHAIRAWDDIQEQEGFLKFNHDYYLKMWQLASPKISGDFILFDEAQDADPVMLSIIESQKHAQKIYVGDQYQAIYEWRGAENALSKVKVDKSLWLTQSFRFGEAIAAEANHILGFLNAPVEVHGLPSVNSRIEKVQEPKAILCRTNAGVIQQVMQEQTKGRDVAILGRTQELIDFSKACGDLQKGIRTGHHELAPFKSWVEVRAYVERYPEQTHEIKTMIDLVDRFGVESLLNALRKVVDEPRSDVLISTAHKAKGREWESVKLAGDYLHPSDMDAEDLRLAYVSVTRAINRLDMTEWALTTPKNDSSLRPTIEESSITNSPMATESESEKSNSRQGTKWTYVEDLDLIRYCKSGRTMNEIAEIIGRSVSALEARLAKWYLYASLGEDARKLESKRFSDETWSEAKYEKLLNLWETDIDVRQLAAELDVSLTRLAFQVINADLVIIDEAFDSAVVTFYGL